MKIDVLMIYFMMNEKDEEKLVRKLAVERLEEVYKLKKFLKAFDDDANLAKYKPRGQKTALKNLEKIKRQFLKSFCLAEFFIFDKELNEIKMKFYN